MKQIQKLFFAATALLAVSACVHAQSPRRVIKMNAGWTFAPEAQTALQGGVAVAGWRAKVASASEDFSAPDLSDADFAPIEVGADPFGGKSGFAWYRAVLPTLPASTGAGLRRVLRFPSVDDSADVYLNGRKLVHHDGWNDAFDVEVDTFPNGPNLLAVRVQNGAGPGGIAKPVTLGYAPASQGTRVVRADFNDASWKRVHLPHDFVVEQTFGTFTRDADGSHGFLPTGAGWYRKVFSLPASDKGKSAWLNFDGVYRNSRVYLNGQLVASHPSGYAPFNADISRAAKFGGKNVLAVYADARATEGWWYEGGGIYRNVFLNVAAPLHIAPWGVFVSSQLPEPSPGKPAASAKLMIKTTLQNDGSAGNAVLRTRITNAQGAVVAQAATPVSLSAKSRREFTQTATISNPRLWSLTSPNLYRAESILVRGNNVLDSVSNTFGVRTIRFDASRGFFLNGVPVKIQGTCNHGDFAGVGVALSDTLQAWRVRKLQTMGSNAYRTSHNPVGEPTLEACDRLGMLVMDETRHLGDATGAKTPSGTGYSDLSDLRAQIMRDRNHPSVIMWSMANEEPLQGTDEGARIFAAMKAVVNQLDGTRPVSSAKNGGVGEGFTKVQDLEGVNYNPGAYQDFHNRFPLMPVYGSETGSTVSTRGIYANDAERGYVSAYDLNAPPWAQTAQDAWRPIAQQPFNAGGFVWTGFDYKGEPTPYSWPCVNSHFGILDLCGFPKDNFYYYQSQWRATPMVHILPHWNWPGRENQPIEVWAYANAARVELFLNGQTLGIKEMPPHGHVQWSVPYAPGILLARSYDASGKLLATDKVETTGAPAALKLLSERTQLQADGEDVQPIEVQVLDAQGRIVPIASDLVTFRVTGAGGVAGVGNGDPSDHAPDKASTRRAFNGRCMVIVGAKELPGAITLTASAPGLKSATLALRSSSD